MSVPINRDCENIFNHLGEMPDSYIIFCSIQELLQFYLLDNKQRTTINGLYQTFKVGSCYFICSKTNAK